MDVIKFALINWPPSCPGLEAPQSKAWPARPDAPKGVLTGTSLAPMNYCASVQYPSEPVLFYKA